ncbi:HD domain protein [Mycobacterium ulcerans str. Harvey]|uniref:HD domain protein n=1 Tax=Mycobacterium ulcerans str. Harvey TaxID=1299332 RepID=A0ABN0R9G1_MYCUL|nr:HD domain protein [Mycobacterium ulcerans str. Harvey]
MADDQSTTQAVVPSVESLPVVEAPEAAPAETLKTTSSASRRVRARLARRITAQRSAINPVLEPLVAVHREVYPKADLSLLQRAYEVADQRHAGQFRHSGDPYITHPLAVANILAELGMDSTTLVAALLHDTVEDTGYTLEALSEEFGEEVGHLVDGVTKLDRVVLGSAAEGETIRKMITAMARDPRVLVIKVADRLHNMRTMRFLPRRSRHARPARHWKSLPPWRIDWGWPASSGSSKTCRSPSCIPRSMTRSCAWWPAERRRATPTWPRSVPRSSPR